MGRGVFEIANASTVAANVNSTLKIFGSSTQATSIELRQAGNADQLEVWINSIFTGTRYQAATLDVEITSKAQPDTILVDGRIRLANGIEVVGDATTKIASLTIDGKGAEKGLRVGSGTTGAVQMSSGTTRLLTTYDNVTSVLVINDATKAASLASGAAAASAGSAASAVAGAAALVSALLAFALRGGFAGFSGAATGAAGALAMPAWRIRRPTLSDGLAPFAIQASSRSASSLTVAGSVNGS